MRTALRCEISVETGLAERPGRLRPEAMRRIAENFRNLRRNSSKQGSGHPGELNQETEARAEKLGA